MSEKITVLYLRHSSGGGGGADTIIINTARVMDLTRFSLIIAYLRKYNDNLSLIASKFKNTGIQYFEFPGGRIFDVKQFIHIIKLIKKHRVRIIHCHDPKTDFYGYLLKLLFPQLLFVSTIHGWIARRLRSKLYIKIDRFALRKCDAVIAVSEQIEQTARKYGIRETYLIHNSIDLNKWKPLKKDLSLEGKSARPFQIGFIGRISKEKGIFDLVHVAKKILDHQPDYEFLVAGKGPEEESMKALVKQLGLEKNFQFLGHLEEDQLHDLYQKLDLLLLTSYTEGLPMTVLEACAMHVPVIATNVGGVSEVITHKFNGLLADVGDIDTIVNNILYLSNNRDIAYQFAENGRPFVETKFSIDNNVKKLESIYMQILKKS